MSNFLQKILSRTLSSSSTESQSGGSVSSSGKHSSSKHQSLFKQTPYCEASLVSGDMRKVVQLPQHLKPYENEWLAVHVFDFFQYINLFYGTIAHFCTPKSCPHMSGGPGVDYSWTDTQKKTSKVSAPQYVDYMMTSIQNQLDDEQIFPTKAGVEFPVGFRDQMLKSMFRHIFRLFSHLYYCHYEHMLHLEQEAHLNTLLRHCTILVKEFQILDKKELTTSFGVLGDVLESMKFDWDPVSKSSQGNLTSGSSSPPATFQSPPPSTLGTIPGTPTVPTSDTAA